MQIDLCLSLAHFKLSSKTNSFINIVVHCTDHNYGHSGMTVLTRCAYGDVMLYVRYGIYHGSHRDLVPLIAECIPSVVALVYRFIMFYRTVALSDNMVVNYIANAMIFVDRSTTGQNVRHIILLVTRVVLSGKILV